MLGSGETPPSMVAGVSLSVGGTAALPLPASRPKLMALACSAYCEFECKVIFDVGCVGMLNVAQDRANQTRDRCARLVPS